jgi:hypothetical protein
MKNLYSKNHYEKIINILTSHNIKLEFEDPTSLVSAVEEIQKYCLYEELKVIFEKSNNNLCVEFDILNKKTLSIGYGYYNSTLNICGYAEVSDHLNLIAEIFSFYPAAVINYFGNYLIMKSASTGEVEKFYYFIDNRILYDLDEDSWSDVLSLFNLSEKSIDFLKLDTEYTALDYIGFLPNGDLDNIGFNTLVGKFLQRNPNKEYLNYANMEKIVRILERNFDPDMTIGMQYSTKKQCYFGIELFLTTEQAKFFYQMMYDNQIISDVEYKNFVSMNFSEKYKSAVVKLRWETENNFMTKFYLEKYTDS